MGVAREQAAPFSWRGKEGTIKNDIRYGKIKIVREVSLFIFWE